MLRGSGSICLALSLLDRPLMGREWARSCSRWRCAMAAA